MIENQKVYLATSKISNYVKVGISKKPKDRSKIFKNQTGIPFLIYFESEVLKNAKIVEQKVLKHFSNKISFGEWIEEDKKTVLKFLKTILNEAPKDNISYHKQITDNTIVELSTIPDILLRESNYIFSYKEGLDTRYSFCYLQDQIIRILSFKYKEQAFFYLGKLKQYSIPVKEFDYY